MEYVKIVLLGVGAAIVYGILQDQVTARVCVEYFTIGHPDYFGLVDPTLLALEWGVIATWWTGLILGIAAALAARLGSRPRLTVRDLLRPTLLLMACIGCVVLVAGVVGFIVARAGGVYLVEPLASAVPRARHVAFLADLWAHTAAYAAGLLGGALLCVWIVCQRVKARRALAAAGGTGEVGLSFNRVAVVGHGTGGMGWLERTVLIVFLLVGACGLILGVLFVATLSLLSGL